MYKIFKPTNFVNNMSNLINTVDPKKFGIEKQQALELTAGLTK